MNSAGEDSASAATALADAIEKAGSPMVTSVDQLRKTAAQQLASKEDAWRPHATALAEWLPKARKAKAQSEAQSNLKAAEKWLKDAAEAIRNERFAPIADHARRIWDRLKLQSNVSLESVQLGGTGKARKVELRVTVDGQQGAALGVMSQGELHSLALSLFIPRATLKESPFRFVVIDDPVQSMDPARVDGLAPGAYRFDRTRSLLEPGARGDRSSSIQSAALSQEVLGRAAAVLAFTLAEGAGTIDGPRDYRVANLEAGLAGEVAYLSATARGLGVCGVGAYYDAEVAALLAHGASRPRTLYLQGLGAR